MRGQASGFLDFSKRALLRTKGEGVTEGESKFSCDKRVDHTSIVEKETPAGMLMG